MLILLGFGYFSDANAQFNSLEIDSLEHSGSLTFKYTDLVIPAILVGYGIIGLESHSLLSINSEIREEVNEHIDEKVTIDDFSQYAPVLSVYGLNAYGIKGKNNFGDRTVVLATAYLIMSPTVYALKKMTRVERPDGSSKNSFPSGHTATAFVGAEFLWQEYSDVSIWYGISGYAVAAGTGFFRMYNNKHWLTDIAAGAGIGILSTKIAYWIHPFIKEKIFGNENGGIGILMPFYNGKEYGVEMMLSL
ncbi:phosphoesterase PA-phosphatase related [Chloroherpeton thalassium ATCC 35110]|uniref:Phosphoesterase PA-phosphatase related n=1 Tax=Chloroherpeton thalassium (strain ATCC 35110 / GB-78) TaxID=517418 RepID=B3QVE6_CHLT3|nr:phosphatase PAP2 family protein [Chloroherpeton thalassium]ACF14546.1 phosphoesterase PA-phosphatase related [Chloroherpeton thalassium ATCC 35110]